jgi:hypothetical protein
MALVIGAIVALAVGSWWVLAGVISYTCSHPPSSWA